MKNVSIDLIQKCHVSDNSYSKPWFIKLLTDNTTQEQFDRFCREIAHLNAHYVQTYGLWATDKPELVNNDLLFEIEEIDFDHPINFKQIS